MKKIIFLLFLFQLLKVYPFWAQGDSQSKTYRNFPITICLHLQNLAMPFKDLKSNFKHFGISIGTEVSHSSKNDWIQQFQIGFSLNKGIGNSFFMSTQTVYRPFEIDNFFPEVKMGVGWQRIFHPVETMVFKKGQWEKAVGGKSQVIVPMGVGVSYHKYQKDTYYVPFINYQIIPSLFYNRTIPVNFYSAFQLGSNVHINY